MRSSIEQKIVSREKLLTAVTAARAAGKTIVQCHGCFDIVHPGHIRYLQFARGQGDVLIVSLTGDENVSKGGSHPYIPQDLRAENLAALMFVDHVFVDASPSAESILGAVKPDVYVKGHEYVRSTDPAFLAEKGVVDAYGGRIIFSSGEVVFSSTDLIEHLERSESTRSNALKILTKRAEISQSSIGHMLGRFKGLNVLVLGDVILDRYVFCDAFGVASESPMLNLTQRGHRDYVGGAAIVARHAAAMGARVFLLGAGGSDARSREVTNVLEAEGVESQLISSRPTVVQKTRFLVDDTKLFKVASGERLPLDSLAERQAARILESKSKNVDAVIFCDFGYGMITGSLLNRVLPTLRHNAGTLTADISGGRADMLGFTNIDLLCPTELELRAALNDHDSGLSTVAWVGMEKTQTRHLFVTLEKRGMVMFERQSQNRNSPEWSGRLKSEQLPSLALRSIDRLGCGDALLAGATLALASGGSLMEAAYLGNAAAAIELSMLGNHPVSANRLREWTSSRPELLCEPVSAPTSSTLGVAEIPSPTAISQT